MSIPLPAIMNLATLVQSQNLKTLLAALGGESGLVPGRTVEARLVGVATDGTATAMVGDTRIALKLEGPQARQAPLQLGTTLTLRIDEGGPDGALRATLVETSVAQRPSAVPASPATAATTQPQVSAQPPPGQTASPAGTPPVPVPRPQADARHLGYSRPPPTPITLAPQSSPQARVRPAVTGSPPAPAAGAAPAASPLATPAPIATTTTQASAQPLPGQAASLAGTPLAVPTSRPQPDAQQSGHGRPPTIPATAAPPAAPQWPEQAQVRPAVTGSPPASTGGAAPAASQPALPPPPHAVPAANSPAQPASAGPAHVTLFAPPQSQAQVASTPVITLRPAATPATDTPRAGIPPPVAPSPAVSNPIDTAPARRVPITPQAAELMRQIAAMPQAARPAAPSAPVTPETARAAAGPLLATALARQDSLAPLLANLLSLTRGPTAATLPRALRVTAEQVLAHAVPAQDRPPAAKALARAVTASGIFAESRAAAGEPSARPVPDLKLALTALRDLLAPVREAAEPARAGSTQQAGPGPTAAEPPPPPRRDALPAPQPVAEPTLSATDKLSVIATTLAEQAEAGLDRIKLAQFASLPVDRPHLEQAGQQRWHVEVPLALQSGIAMLPLQVERDGSQREQTGAGGPLWKIRFALDVEPIGPMQGLVTLRGREVSVRLWAEREQAATRLRAHAPELEAALEAASFAHGTVEVSTGRPVAAQPMAGQFLDRMS